jgi:hypothetical protein
MEKYFKTGQFISAVILCAIILFGCTVNAGRVAGVAGYGVLVAMAAILGLGAFMLVREAYIELRDAFSDEDEEYGDEEYEEGNG